MKGLSLFSGIEGASVALAPLGFNIAAFSEVDKYCDKLLKFHYPNTPNLGDITKIDFSNYRDLDFVIGGSPCQNFSLIGNRSGLDGEKGKLTLSYVTAIEEIKPKYFIWENVVGVLSDKTNAFGNFISGLLGCNEVITRKWGNSGFIIGSEYAITWRVFDSQYFGVPQRRRRVYIVGYRHEGRRDRCGIPAQILFEETDNNRNGEKSDHIWNENTSSDIFSFSAGQRFGDWGVVAPTLRIRSKTSIFFNGSLRMLTPIECERLQGFPDSYTSPMGSDIQRYSGLGNSFTVPVIRWIGRRIKQVDQLI